MKLYYSRNPNPRLAVATARYLNAPVEYEFAAPLAPGQSARFRKLNPALRLPILEENGAGLFEADAIACRLSLLVGSDFWETGLKQPDMIRWISWGKENFVRATDMVQFELGTRLRYDLGPTDTKQIEKGLAMFHEASQILESHLADNMWLANDRLSYADFRMATFLPFNEVMNLPLQQYPSVSRWVAQLNALDAWHNPFAGLHAPPLPPVKK